MFIEQPHHGPGTEHIAGQTVMGTTHICPPHLPGAYSVKDVANNVYILEAALIPEYLGSL